MVQKIRVNFVYVFYVLFFLFMVHRLFFASIGIVEKATSYVVYPFFKVKSVVVYPFQKASQFTQDLQNLKNKVNDLTQERDELRGQLVQSESLKQFSDQTKEVREFAQRYSYKNKKLAQVLLHNISEKEDVIFVDLGSNENVQKDDPVVYQNMLVGRIIELYPWYSKVALITDQRCKISAQCKKGVTGICCGKNGGQLELNFVPHFKDVSVGDSLTSTGKGLIYPKGFGLGTVSAMQSDNVTHYIQVQPMFDIQNVEYVYVLSK